MDFVFNAASIFLAPYLQTQVAIVDERNSLFAEKVFVKHRASLDRAICRLIAPALNAKGLDCLEW